MFSKKKWIAMFTVITVVLLLGACGDKGNDEQTVEGEPKYDNPRNHTAEDFMPLSEGFEEYPVWIETAESPVRDSSVDKVFIFKKGKVTAYKLEDTTIEDILDLSDDELVQLASKSTNKILDDLVDNVNSTSVTKSIKEEKNKSLKDIYLEFNGGERSPLSSKYTLDITIDELGQNTKSINLKIPEAYHQLSYPDFKNLPSVFYDYYTYTTDPNYNHTVETYSRPLKELEKYGSFKAKDGQELTDPPQPETFVPDPIGWDTADEEITFNGDIVHQKIFDTNFSGIKTDNGSLLTRVDESFVGFRLDDPNTDKENVTIEGK